MNAKLERMFSRMNRVKTDYRNRLGRERLDSCLRIVEEGPTLQNFNPNKAIDLWYNEKVGRLSAKPHKYPSKRKRIVGKNGAFKEVIDLSMITLSDLENDSDDQTDAFFKQEHQPRSQRLLS